MDLMKKPIQNSNSASCRDEELRRMTEARMANRAKASEIMGSLVEMEKPVDATNGQLWLLFHR